MWHQRLAPYFTADTSVVDDLGCSAPIFRATPSLGPYITRGQGFVDRTLRACLVMFSPRHLTSHLFRSYISTAHFLHPQGLCFLSFLCVLGQYRLRAWVSEDNEKVTGIFSGYTSRPGPRIRDTKSLEDQENLRNVRNLQNTRRWRDIKNHCNA